MSIKSTLIRDGDSLDLCSLVYSPDDKGYYWDSTKGMSQIFNSQQEAERALKHKELKWG